GVMVWKEKSGGRTLHEAAAVGYQVISLCFTLASEPIRPWCQKDPPHIRRLASAPPPRPSRAGAPADGCNIRRAPDGRNPDSTRAEDRYASVCPRCCLGAASVHACADSGMGRVLQPDR